MTHSAVSRALLLLLLLVALGHAQQPQEPPGAAVRKGAATGQEAAPAGSDALREEIVAQERAELDSLKAGDMAAFANFLADDAVFLDAAGAAGKAEVVKNTAGFRLHEYTMTDVRFVALAADSGLIAYRMAEAGTSHGKEFAAKVYVSALWLRRGGRWLCVFSQETAAK
ncbi:MAG: nuclear transport factor 2 family protein [Terriglobales bacterium]